jgi:ankyrin repeat protein
MLKRTLIAIVMLGAAGCSEPPLTEIGSGWFVDAGKAPWSHLYRVDKGKRVLVDRQIASYRLYYKTCLAYETSRPRGQVIFMVAGNLTPYPVTDGDNLRPWRIDVDGLRRFDTQDDANGRRLLAIEFIDFMHFCTPAQMTRPFQGNWAETTQLVPGSARIVESVLDVNGADSFGNSALSEPVRLGQVVLMDELLRAGADVNAANKRGGTLLMTAVWSRKTEVVRQLLEAGARVNAQTDDGNTALMDAAHTRNPEMAELLIDAGADVTIRDDLGRNAAARLPDGGNPEMERLRARLARAATAAAK